MPSPRPMRWPSADVSSPRPEVACWRRPSPHTSSTSSRIDTGVWPCRSSSTALGVPVGLILGQSSWRLPLLLVSTVGFVALLGIGLRLPPLRYPSSSLADRLRPLAQPRLVAGLLVSTGVLCASYTCFTYA